MLLTHDDIVGESFYNDLLPQVIERLSVSGLLQTDAGADVVFPPGFTNRDGRPVAPHRAEGRRRLQLRHQ